MEIKNDVDELLLVLKKKLLKLMSLNVMKGRSTLSKIFREKFSKAERNFK